MWRSPELSSMSEYCAGENASLCTTAHIAVSARPARRRENPLLPAYLTVRSDPDLQDVVVSCLRIRHIDALQHDLVALLRFLQVMLVRAREVPHVVAAQLHHVEAAVCDQRAVFPFP